MLNRFGCVSVLMGVMITVPAYAAPAPLDSYSRPTEYAYEPAKTFATVNNACMGLFDSVRNPVTLINEEKALNLVQECILYGVDPLLILRPRSGTAPAKSIPRERIQGTTCAPFESCFNKTSTLRKADPRDLLYSNNATFTGGGAGGKSVRSTFAGPYDAPQFNTKTPTNEQLPAHLDNGGSVTVYGDGSLAVPDDSLVNPDNATNYYAENGKTNFTRDSTVYVPPSVNGQIAQQAPIIVMQNTVIQFSDGGLIQLPAVFDGYINGRHVTGGQWIYIAHNGKLQVPSGTGIYPMPSGSTPLNPNVDYTGPNPSLPSNVSMQVNERNQPGEARWW